MDIAESSFSVEGILGNLDSSDEIIEHTLNLLNQLIPSHWAEISERLSEIENLSEDRSKPYYKLASLVASKIFFHIQSYEDALNHALNAQEYFRVDEPSEYVQKLTEQCIDIYREYQQYQYNLKIKKMRQQKQLDNNMENLQNEENPDENDVLMKQGNKQAEDQQDEQAEQNAQDGQMGEEKSSNIGNINQLFDENSSMIEDKVGRTSIDNRLIEIVERMQEYCYVKGDFKHALGIAIECRRLDDVEKTIVTSNNRREMLDHCFKLCENTVNSRAFRDEILQLLVRLYNEEDEENKNYNYICRCYFYLNNVKPISQILWNLINDVTNNDNTLLVIKLHLI